MTRPRPAPWPGQPEPVGPTDAQYAAYARQILAWHSPVPIPDGRAANWCTCGTALVLCPYQSAATRFLAPPATG